MFLIRLDQSFKKVLIKSIYSKKKLIFRIHVFLDPEHSETLMLNYFCNGRFGIALSFSKKENNRDTICLMML